MSRANVRTALPASDFSSGQSHELSEEAKLALAAAYRLLIDLARKRRQAEEANQDNGQNAPESPKEVQDD
jgi:hypothetical protein